MLTKKRLTIKRRIRAKIAGTKRVPRLSVYKSNRFIYAQAIDDTKGVTLASASGETAKAHAVGQEIAKKVLAAKIKRVVFDRGGYRFHGRVKDLADGAKEGGLLL